MLGPCRSSAATFLGYLCWDEKPAFAVSIQVHFVSCRERQYNSDAPGAMRHAPATIHHRPSNVRLPAQNIHRTSPNIQHPTRNVQINKTHATHKHTHTCTRTISTNQHNDTTPRAQHPHRRQCAPKHMQHPEQHQRLLGTTWALIAYACDLQRKQEEEREARVRAEAQVLY